VCAQKADANGSKPSPCGVDGYCVTVSPGSGKSHVAQAIGQAVLQQGHRVLYRETHQLLDELAEANLDGSRKEFIESAVACLC
jgi:DNA replication protein DnaC